MSEERVQVMVDEGDAFSFLFLFLLEEKEGFSINDKGAVKFVVRRPGRVR